MPDTRCHTRHPLDMGYIVSVNRLPSFKASKGPHLVLGSAQWGMDYGITNQTGQVPPTTIRTILKQATDVWIDTAVAYGQAETVIGNLTIKRPLVTKLQAGNRLADSLHRLSVNQVAGVLVHDEANHDDAMWHHLQTERDSGRAAAIGVSLYTPEALNWWLERDIDMVQLPLNILDQRFLKWLPRLKERGIVVHARSPFLQGLLLTPLDQLPPYFHPIRPLLSRIPEPRLPTLLGFLRQIPGLDGVVVGVTSLAEYQQVNHAMMGPIPDIDWEKWVCHDNAMILPIHWPAIS